MPRIARIAPGGLAYHVLNRANENGLLFHTPGCYREFLQIIREATLIDSMRVLAYCAMPNHWHLLLWPRKDGDLARFMHRVSLRHTQRWHERRQTVGRGHLYQGRYKSFAISTDRHLLTVCRYIERNPLRAGLVTRSQDWPWSSAGARVPACMANIGRLPVAPMPVELPSGWLQFVDSPQNEEELEAIRTSVRHGLPFGDPGWRSTAAAQFGVRLELGKGGRPPKKPLGRSEAEAETASLFAKR